MITAAVVGSQICALLLVIALGCTCRLYALRMREQRTLLHQATSPLMRLQEEIYARRLAPPPYNEAMLTSRPFEEARREYIQRLWASQLARRNQQSDAEAGSPGAMGEDGSILQRQCENTNSAQSRDDGTLILDVTGQVSSGESTLGSSQGQTLMSVCDSDSVRDSSNVQLILGSGIQARWHRPTNKPEEDNTHINSPADSENQNALNTVTCSVTETSTAGMIDCDSDKPSSSNNEDEVAAPATTPGSVSSDTELIVGFMESSLESLAGNDDDDDTQLLIA